MLRFQAECGVFFVGNAKCRCPAIEEVARVQLHPRLGGIDPHHSAGGRFIDVGAECHLPSSPLVEHIAVIVPPRKVIPFDLVNPFADPVRGAEIKGRACDGVDFPRRNECIVRWQNAIRVERQHMIVTGVRKACQVPKGVVRQVDDRRFVRAGSVLHRPSVAVIEAVFHRRVKCAGKTFFAIGGGIFHSESDVVLSQNPPLTDRLHVPNDGIKSFASAVQRIGSIVGGKRIFYAIQSKFRIPDPIGITTDQRTEEGALSIVVGSGFQDRGDVTGASISVGDLEVANDPAERQHFDGNSSAVVERVQIDGAAIGSLSELCGRERHSSGYSTSRSSPWQQLGKSMLCGESVDGPRQSGGFQKSAT